MTNQLKIATILIALLSINSYAQQPFSFKGINLNDSVQTLKEKISVSCGESTVASFTESYCSRNSKETFTFGGVNVDQYYPVFRLLNNKIGSISVDFWNTSYEQMSDVLIEKYGKPNKVTKDKIQTKVGTSYENETQHWENADATMTLSRYSVSVEKSSFVITSKDYIVKMAQLKKEQAKINVKDL